MQNLYKVLFLSAFAMNCGASQVKIRFKMQCNETTGWYAKVAMYDDDDRFDNNEDDFMGVEFCEEQPICEVEMSKQAKDGAFAPTIEPYLQVYYCCGEGCRPETMSIIEGRYKYSNVLCMTVPPEAVDGLGYYDLGIIHIDSRSTLESCDAYSQVGPYFEPGPLTCDDGAC